MCLLGLFCLCHPEYQQLMRACGQLSTPGLVCMLILVSFSSPLVLSQHWSPPRPSLPLVPSPQPPSLRLGNSSNPLAVIPSSSSHPCYSKQENPNEVAFFVVVLESRGCHGRLGQCECSLSARHRCEHIS